MGDIKGAGSVYLRNLLKAKGQDAWKTILDKLSTEEQERLQTVTYVSWTSIEFAVKTCVLGTEILYPNEVLEKRIINFCASMAQDQMKGVYKFLFRFAKPDFVINQAAKIWKTIHNVGKAYMAKNQDNHSCDFIIEDYPDMPELFLTMQKGYLTAVMEMTGVKNINTKVDFSNKNKWIYHLSWTGK